jgi:hypothetical protein
MYVVQTLKNRAWCGKIICFFETGRGREGVSGTTREGGGIYGRWVGSFDASNVALLGNSRGTGSCLSNGLISDCA